MSEERSMTTDPTPRTAATARERDIYETVREVIRDYTCLPFGLGEAKEMCSRITSALAAAEAPGRVAALEAVVDAMLSLQYEHGVNCYVTDQVGCRCPIDSTIEWAMDVRLHLAAPASPAGVSGEVCICAITGPAGGGHPNIDCPFHAPAPTPSEPVGRCENCGHEPHDSALGCTFESTAGPDWFCACQHDQSTTPGARDE
jgi:hypothetical protein